MSRSPSTHEPEYLDTPEAVGRFVASIAPTVRTLALDTEGASFHRFVDRIYLLQLSTRERTAVIDPLPIGTPETLGAILESPDVEVVFHDADYDLRLLQQDYGWHVRHIFDTRIAAQLLGLRAFGLAALLDRYFGVKLEKKYQRADWSTRPLTEGMLEYAAQDTMYLLALRDRMEEDLREKGRWSWALEEFRRLEGTRWDPEEEATAFLRMKGARDLNRRELAILREVVQWRDLVAAELDRATFRVIGNEALLEIARQKPESRETLGAIKGVPRGILEGRSAELLGAVRRGLSVPDGELPRFPRAPRWEREPDFDELVSKLKQVRDEAAQRLDLDPGVLCSRDRLETIARRRPASIEEMEEMPELRRWQVEVLGPQLLRVLRKYPRPGAEEPEAEPSPYREEPRAR